MAAPEEYVTADELRRRFNEGLYYERLQSREYTAEITDVGPPRRGMPAEFRSQIAAYHDSTGRTVAIVHQYGNVHGDAAPGTLPDPKFLFEAGVRYKLEG